MTVLELKIQLQTERGYPAYRMDLLYKDKPLENSRYLFEYGLAHSSTIFVLLMLKHDILVHVDTFWGKQYHLYVDLCTTGFGIIASILRRTVSQSVVDISKLYELFLPKHTLVLFNGSQVMDWDNCLGLYNIEDGSILRMSTIGLAHEMDVQKVPVVLDTGKLQHITASKFDRWSTIVLKLHGMTGYPVNLMRLRNGHHTLDFSDTIGSVPKGSNAVKLDVSAVKTDNDLLYGIPLKFRIAKGVTELLKVAPSRTIKSVKDTLERVGVPNASMYDLVIEGYRLPSDKRVVDVIEEYKVPIELSLRQYPVFIHGTQNVIYKMLAYSKETLATFLMRVKMKTGLSYQDYLLLVCGSVLDDNESLPVFDTQISVKSSIFLIARKQSRSFFIVHGDWMTKVRIPAHPKLQQIKDILWKEKNVPEGGLASIGTFLQWYFANQHRNTDPDPQMPLKEQMMVYEENIGNKYLQMQIETHRARRKGKPKVDKALKDEQEEFDTKAEKKYPARDLSFTQAHKKASLSHLPRHISAQINGQEGHPGYIKRKAFTTLPVIKPRQRPHRMRRRKAAATTGALMAPPRYKYKDAIRHHGEHHDEQPNSNKEWVFCLTHDYTVKPTKGRRRTMHY